ncbi:MAG: DUF5615 family PIN-like protein [Acidimicrobiales bacterium]
MRFLLDENLHPLTAEILSVLGRRDGHEFIHILTVAVQGTDDSDIPAICQDNDVQALITVNHKDFGARKALYQALIASNVSVVVVRPGKLRFITSNQVMVLSGAYPHFTKFAVDATGPILIKVTPSGTVSRSLEELEAEILGQS